MDTTNTTEATRRDGSALERQVRPQLQRWGVRHVPASQPWFERMDDGYWTPWHLAEDEVARLHAALLRCTENVERWMQTDQAASPEESRSIYEQMCAALGRQPIDFGA